MSTKGGTVFTFSLSGGRMASLPPSVTPLAARLNYSSTSTTVALENGHLPTTELMFHNNGLLHHNVIIVLSAMLTNNFSTSTYFATS